MHATTGLYGSTAGRLVSSRTSLLDPFAAQMSGHVLHVGLNDPRSKSYFLNPSRMSLHLVSGNSDRTVKRWSSPLTQMCAVLSKQVKLFRKRIQLHMHLFEFLVDVCVFLTETFPLVLVMRMDFSNGIELSR